jgi:hypothetical protein
LGQALLSSAVRSGDDRFGGSLGAVRSDAGWSARLEAGVKEACAVGLAEGAEVAPDPILAALERAPDAFQSSMQKDVAAGRAPEMAPLSGVGLVASCHVYHSRPFTALFPPLLLRFY